MPSSHLKLNRFYLSVVFLTFLIQTTLISSIYADVPPPENYQETCTVAIQSENGDDCLSCSANFDMNDCESTYGAQGYTKNCQSWGGSVWTEVWCKASPNSVEEAAEPTLEETETASESKGSESCAQSTQPPITFGLLFVWLTLIIRPRLRSIQH